MSFSKSFNLSSLDGKNGLIINGDVSQNNGFGQELSGLGDVNNDGFNDIAIGTDDGEITYIIYGHSGVFESTFNTTMLNGNNGFIIYGAGYPSKAGDINNDQINDIIISKNRKIYVLFGQNRFDSQVDLSSINSSQGFVVNSITAQDRLGLTPTGLGDFNGDGNDDIILSASDASNGIGQSYVIFGNKGDFNSTFSLLSLNGSNGFTINGINEDASGSSVAGIGDFNGDGFDDILIGAFAANNFAGQSYVVFGGNFGLAPIMNLSSLNGSNGFIINGIIPDSSLGSTVAGLGDFNGDGLADIVIGASSYAGSQSYVIFGNKGDFNSTFSLLSLNGSNGFTINGAGYSLSASDINCDGFPDILAERYVIFGGNKSFNSQLDVNSLDDYGFIINDNSPYTNLYLGYSVSGVLDINNDSCDDMLIGTKALEQCYVIFGGDKLFENNTLNSSPSSSSSTTSWTTSNTLSITKSTSPTSTKTATQSPSISASCSSTSSHTTFATIPPTLSSSSTTTVSKTASYTQSATTSFSHLPTKSFSVSTTSSLSYSATHTPIKTIVNYIDLNNLNGFNGFKINGGTAHNAGDFNKDGFEDILISSNAQVCLIYGDNKTPHASYDLNHFIEDEGFCMHQLTTKDLLIEKLTNNNLGYTMSTAGDFNKDGYSDLLIGDPSASPNSKNSIGQVYIIFGQQQKISGTLQLASLNGTNGFKINGNLPYDYLGSSIAGIGDVNNDGFDDIGIGAYGVSNGINNIGTVYVIYGKQNEFNPEMEVSSLNENLGYKISGNSGEYLGLQISGVGDINGDGYSDFAFNVGVGFGNKQFYIVYGRNSMSSLTTTDLNSSNCLVIRGMTWPQEVYGGGDINGDGFSDIVIGDPGSSPNSKSLAGSIYIIFGKQNLQNIFNINDLDGITGFRVNGINSQNELGYLLSSTGDVNGDGYSDIVTSYFDAPLNYNPNKGVVIFGKSSGFQSVIDLSSLDGNNGFFISNYLTNVSALYTISGTDFNNDGFDDIFSGGYLLYGSASLPSITTSLISPSLTASSSISKSITPTVTTTVSPSPTVSPSKSYIPAIPVPDKIYATFALEVYDDSDDFNTLNIANAGGGRLPIGWTKVTDSVLEDIGTVISGTLESFGFFARAYKNNALNSVVVSFRGTNDIADLLFADVRLAFSTSIPSQYTYLKQFIDRLDNLNITLNKHLSFTGHSLGGFLAQLASATYNKPAVIFESPAAKNIINNNDFAYKSSDLSNKIKGYNAAPNLINTAGGEHFEEISRLYPEYDFSPLSIFTLQQHSMIHLLEQYNSEGGLKLKANMHNYWLENGVSYNWLFSENSFNNLFFNNYNQNPYYWERVWSTAVNPNGLFQTTAQRIGDVANKGGIASGSDLSKSGVTINGDNSGNKFFGSTNFADHLNGGTGSDSYWPFSGIDVIHDTGGYDYYYFYTHNMKGITTIYSTSKQGEIKFVNIDCTIGDLYKTDSANIYAFIPVLNSNCDVGKYSSKPFCFGSGCVFHSGDIIVLQLDGSDLKIAYNHKDFADSYKDKILLKNFHNGDFSISLPANNNGKPIVMLGADGNDHLTCSITEDSILAGLGGINTYISDVASWNLVCRIIDNSNSPKIIKITNNALSSGARLLTGGGSGGLEVYGLKATDLIDLSNLNFTSFDNISYNQVANDTTINLYGMTISIKGSNIFTTTLDGSSFAFFNATDDSYTTNLTEVGIDKSIILDAIAQSNVSSEPGTRSNHNLGVIVGAVVGGLAGVAVIGCILYKWWSHKNDIVEKITSPVSGISGRDIVIDQVVEVAGDDNPLNHGY